MRIPPIQPAAGEDHDSKMANTQNAVTKSATKYPPEFELLLCCARTAPDLPRITALVDAGIDWHLFFSLVSAHGLRPLVYKALRPLCWNLLPSDIQSEWRTVCEFISGRALFATGELLRIAQAASAAQIPIAALKGLVFGQMLYGDVTLREFSDLDLLVHDADFFRAVELLERLGYDLFWNQGSRHVKQFQRYVGECKLRNRDLETEIDLHWRVATKATALAPALSDFPAGFQPVSIAGSTALSFAPGDLPLYLAAQGGWDQWCELRRICDLSEFLRRYPQLDWQPSLAAARRLGGLRSMLIGLVLASRLFDAPLPEPALPLIQRDPAVAGLADDAVLKLLLNHNPSDAISRYRFQLKAKQGLAGKLSLLWSIFAERTAEDAAWLMLPRPLWWLYPILRPLRIASKIFNRA